MFEGVVCPLLLASALVDPAEMGVNVDLFGNGEDPEEGVGGIGGIGFTLKFVLIGDKLLICRACLVCCVITGCGGIGETGEYTVEVLCCAEMGDTMSFSSW